MPLVSADPCILTWQNATSHIKTNSSPGKFGTEIVNLEQSPIPCSSDQGNSFRQSGKFLTVLPEIELQSNCTRFELNCSHPPSTYLTTTFGKTIDGPASMVLPKAVPRRRGSACMMLVWPKEGTTDHSEHKYPAWPHIFRPPYSPYLIHISV